MDLLNKIYRDAKGNIIRVLYADDKRVRYSLETPESNTNDLTTSRRVFEKQLSDLVELIENSKYTEASQGVTAQIKKAMQEAKEDLKNGLLSQEKFEEFQRNINKEIDQIKKILERFGRN